MLQLQSDFELAPAVESEFAGQEDVMPFSDQLPAAVCVHEPPAFPDVPDLHLQLV
jgi:hypothetical protein